MQIRFGAVLALAGALCSGALQMLGAQAVDSVPAATGTFIGHVVASTDSSPARSVEVRLLFVDSSKTVKSRSGADSLDIFLDSLRTRVAVTDSTGAFAVRRLTPGHYLFRLRRIGFQPMDGVLTVVTDTLRVRFVMDVASVLLSKVQITETSVDVVSEHLRQVGYKSRNGLGIAHTFVDRKEILRRNRDTLGELLSTYGIYDGDFYLDHLPVEYDDVVYYPAELVIGIEIYRHGRPVEFNMTRPRPKGLPSANVFASAGVGFPLVVIWTYIPAR